MVPGVAWLDPEFLKGFFHNQDNIFFLYVCTIPGTSSTTVALPGKVPGTTGSASRISGRLRGRAGKGGEGLN